MSKIAKFCSDRNGNRIPKLFLLMFLGGIFFLAQVLDAQKHAKIESSLESDSIYKYATVFPNDKVNRMEIIIKPCDWDTLTSILKKKFGEQGKGGPMGGPFPKMGDSMAFRGMGPGMGPGMMPPPGMDSLRRMHPPQFGGRRPFMGHPMGKPGGMMPPPFGDGNESKFVPCIILFNGQKWDKAGFRLKGNSSLMMSWSQGIKKLPFRLNFTKFCDTTKLSKKDKFYGFKELSFSSNMSDPTFMHEKLAGDLFREGGIKAPHSAFYEVYINIGGGLVYAGLYSVIEVVDDSMLKDQFGTKKGNCYKPDMPGGSFAADTFDRKSFVKKNNKKEANWSDVELLFTLLHSDLRKTDPKKWQAKLENVFDVPVFIKWLAINTTFQNWDTYGNMPHNYYLYNNPATGKLTWIPWDNNEALTSGRMGSTSMSLSEIDENWPLIRFILDQPEYKEMYKAEIQKFLATAFDINHVNDKIDAYQKIISTSVKAEKEGYTLQTKGFDFEKAVSELKNYVETRYNEALKYTKGN